LTAKVIFLSLNPGYIERVNRDATKVIEQIPEIKNKIREFWEKTLTHEVDSISPLRSDTDFFTSFNILQDWYWEDKFKTLYLDLYKPADPTFNSNFFLKFKDAVDKKIAIIQYCPYSSCVSEINKKFHIASMEYTRNLVYHLLDKEPEERPLFVLLRSYDLWCEMLGEKTINKKSNFILRKKTTKGWPRGQFITENSFEDNGYSRIIEKLK